MLFRYSTDGFKPQYQNHLKESADFMDNIEYYIQHYESEFLKNNIRQGYVAPDLDFDYYGCFAFLAIPKQEEKRFMLNHLSQEDKNKRRLFKADANINITVFVDNGFVFDSNNKMTLKDAIERQELSVYIPSDSLKQLHNIKKINKPISKPQFK